jgi:peptidoglycan/xylan/chitin deacetylase (PgdA/CDA1 family)
MFSIRRRVGDAIRLVWPDPVILMYHRVAEPEIDPWGLAVSAARFDGQMALLRKARRVMPLTELVDAYKRRALPRAAAAVTFDDGYADNLLNAKPVLTRYGIPATLFLATGTIGSGREYWWDELARLILLSTDGVDAEVQLGAELVRLRIPPGDRGAGRGWRTWKGPTNPREATYLEVWRKLRVLDRAEISKAMAVLRLLFKSEPRSSSDLPMSVTQIAELIDDGLVELGGHTISHPVLPSLSTEEQKREIAGGKAICEALVDRRIDGFAYPYGEFDDRSKTLARECGFSWACSTGDYPMHHTAADLYILPRIQALDWDSESFHRVL